MGRPSKTNQQRRNATTRSTHPGRPKGSVEMLLNPSDDVLNQPLKERGTCAGCAKNTHSPRKRRCNQLPRDSDGTSSITAVIDVSHARGIAEGSARGRKGSHRLSIVHTMARIAKRHSVSLRTLYSWEKTKIQKHRMIISEMNIQDIMYTILYGCSSIKFALFFPANYNFKAFFSNKV